MLNDSDIIRYARIAADWLSIKLPNIEKMKKQMRIAIPESIILDNGVDQLWIDRKYIAYSNHDDPGVHYVYLSKLHIKEENRSYENARKTRGIKVYLPQSIRSECRKAQHEMKKTGLDYYINHEFFERR